MPAQRPFNPPLIVGQILLLQLAQYITLGLILGMLDYMAGYSIAAQLLSLQFFSPSYFNLNSILGALTVFAHLLNALVGGWLLSLIVKRSKQCLDFAVTFRLVDLLWCCVIQGWPKTLGWWVTSVLSTAIMAVFGEHLCMRIELQDIPLRQVGDDL